MPAKVEMIGRKFGRLLVISEMPRHLDPNGRKRRAFRCKCDCGKKIVAIGSDLSTGNTQSCGCLQVESVAKKNRKHGLIEFGKNGKWWKRLPPLYTLWANMKDRCNNPNHKSYKDYGGRGIKVCKRWSDGEDGLSGYECFIADVGKRPSNKHSIDRYPDNDGDYGPHNFRWATRFQQNTNQRRKTPRLVTAGVRILP